MSNKDKRWFTLCCYDGNEDCVLHLLVDGDADEDAACNYVLNTKPDMMINFVFEGRLDELNSLPTLDIEV